MAGPWCCRFLIDIVLAGTPIRFFVLDPLSSSHDFSHGVMTSLMTSLIPHHACTHKFQKGRVGFAYP